MPPCSCRSTIHASSTRPCIGYLLFNEVPGPWSFAGMALIIASSLYLVLTEKRRQATVRALPE